MNISPHENFCVYSTGKHHVGAEAVQSYIELLTSSPRGDRSRLHKAYGLTFGVSLYNKNILTLHAIWTTY